MKVLALILALIVVSVPLLAQSITVQWDPNPEVDLAGYKMYSGVSSGSYGIPVSVGKVMTYTFTGLTIGVKSYFSVTAYNESGFESGFSNEVSFIPGDLNSDGSINVLDVQIMINSILSGQPIAGGELNNDGQVDVLDLQKLINKILGG